MPEKEFLLIDYDNIQPRSERFLEFLRKRSTHRPGTIKRLRGAINAHLGGKLSEAQVDDVLKDLENRGIVVETAGKLTYGAVD